MFKRFESNVFAFSETIRRLLKVHERFAEALKEGIVPAGDEAQDILYEPNEAEERDLMDALRMASGRYDAADFDVDRLLLHIEHDIELFKKILEFVDPITPKEDAKLQKLIEKLKIKPLAEGKRLIFTQYADTAKYLYKNLNPGDKRDDVEVIYSGDKSKERVVGRFAPKANPEYQRSPGESELNTVIATDVLAEGLNLQDCDKIINYDLHWNPVRLIQRFGRIDRIGSEYEVIYGYNFLPETGIEKNLGLQQILHNRIQEIHDTIGEDAEILDNTEKLNEEAMYAIYERDGKQLNFFEAKDEMMDINEAEEVLRQLRNECPKEYERIASLRDGVRTVKSATEKGLYVLCQAGKYQQLYLIDENGEIKTRDISNILGTIKCGPEIEGQRVPQGYNARVMEVKRRFAEEVKQRQSERDYSPSYTQGQRYVFRELRVLFNSTEEDEIKEQINILEAAFRRPLTGALTKELNKIRKNGVTGRDLVKNLADLYSLHNMRDWIDKRVFRLEDEAIPEIVCSEGLG